MIPIPYRHHDRPSAGKVKKELGDPPERAGVGSGESHLQYNMAADLIGPGEANGSHSPFGRESWKTSGRREEKGFLLEAGLLMGKYEMELGRL